MNIYYRQAQLCGRKTGNGAKLPFLMNILYSLAAKNGDHQPFSMDDINAVLFNQHQSIGCSIKAPLPIVSWRTEAIEYELFKGEELRIWPDYSNREREKQHWFSHHAVVYSAELDVFKQSFEALLKHIRKEDDYESKHPKFG
ncbi:hypothetical protein [Shewanella baltica]|uniref:hypothetical protein n=1 Tax=Shewanella baltica TaxID=62322 RepID=UPI0039B103A2